MKKLFNTIITLTNTLLKAVLAVALSLLMLLMLFITIALITDHFISIQRIYEVTSTSINDASAAIAESFSDSSIEREYWQTYLEKLDAKREQVIGTSTISFLFTIFSVTLLSAGVYILKRMDTIANRMDSIVMEIRSLNRWKRVQGSTAYMIKISLMLNSICRYTDLLITQIPNMACLSDLREDLSALKNSLSQGGSSRNGINLQVFNSIVKQVYALKSSVSPHQKKHPYFEEVEKSLSDILEELKHYDFVAFYEELLKDTEADK